MQRETAVLQSIAEMGMIRDVLLGRIQRGRLQLDDGCNEDMIIKLRVLCLVLLWIMFSSILMLLLI